MSEEEGKYPLNCPHPACPAGEQGKANITQHEELKGALLHIGGDLEKVQSNQKDIQEEIRGVSATISESMTKIAVSFERISNINDKMDAFTEKADKAHDEIFTRLRKVEENYVTRTALEAGVEARLRSVEIGSISRSELLKYITLQFSATIAATSVIVWLFTKGG